MGLDSIKSLALAHVETTQQSYEMATDVIERGVPGDFVECGVFAGAQCAAMAQALIDYPKQFLPGFATSHAGRRVHLFDSFQGIPAPGPHDSELIASGNEPGSACCSLEQVKEYMKLWEIPDELLVYHPGWFSETLPPAVLANDSNGWRRELESIAVLRIDCDLYESTKLVMEHLYPLLSPGGWLIVDDWNLTGCRKAVDEACVLHPAYFQKL